MSFVAPSLATGQSPHHLHPFGGSLPQLQLSYQHAPMHPPPSTSFSLQFHNSSPSALSPCPFISVATTPAASPQRLPPPPSSSFMASTTPTPVSQTQLGVPPATAPTAPLSSVAPLPLSATSTAPTAMVPSSVSSPSPSATSPTLDKRAPAVEAPKLTDVYDQLVMQTNSIVARMAMSSETIAKKASATIAARNQDGSLSPAHLDSIDQEIEALLSLRQRLHELVQQAQYLQVVIRASTLATQQYQQQQQQQQQAEQQRQNHYQQAAEHNVPRVQQMTTLKNDFVPFMILPEPKPSLASDSYASGTDPAKRSRGSMSSDDGQWEENLRRNKRSGSLSSNGSLQTVPDISKNGSNNEPGSSPCGLDDDDMPSPDSPTGDDKGAKNSFSHKPHKRVYKKAPLPSMGKACQSCKTTVTPEWRRGPGGAKSLCNACGLQYAKSMKGESSEDAKRTPSQHQQQQQQQQQPASLSDADAKAAEHLLSIFTHGSVAH